jgi:DNA-binding GntR family transcriptional regulator
VQAINGSRASAAAQRSISNADYAYQAIKESILDGRIAPGERLVESQLAEDFELSRTPIREALGRLSAEQMITRGGAGLQVATTPSEGDVDDAYLIREVLDGLAASLAARRMSEAELMLAELTLERMRDGARVGDRAVVDRASSALGDLIYAAAANPLLQRMGRKLSDFGQLIGRLSDEDDRETGQIVEDYGRVVEALHSYSSDDAEAAARSQASRSRKAAVCALATRRERDLTSRAQVAP